MSRLAAFGVNFVIGALFWRNLYGELGSAGTAHILLLLSLQFLSTWMTLGSHFEVNLTLLKGKVIGSKYLLRHLLRTTGFSFFALLAILALLTYFHLLFRLNPGQLFLSAAILAVVTPQTVLASYLTVREKQSILFWLPLLTTLTQVVIVYISGLYSHTNFDVMLWACFLGNSVTTVAAGIYVLIVNKQQERLTTSGLHIQSHTISRNYSAWVVSIASPLLFQLDRFLIGIQGDPTSFTKSTILGKLSVPALIISSLVTNFFYPKIYSAQSKSTKRIFLKTAVSLALAVFIVAPYASELFLSFVSRNQLHLTASEAVAFAFLLSSFFIYSYPDGLFRISKEGQRRQALFLGVATLANFILAPWMFGLFGLAGYYFTTGSLILTIGLLNFKVTEKMRKSMS